MTNDGPADTTLLRGPFKTQGRQGDAALFKDNLGNAVALIEIRSCFAVPFLMCFDPETHGNHPDLKGVKARCPLLAGPDFLNYGGWDDPVFLRLCASLEIDPSKQRPRYDAWCQQVGEALLVCASEALDDSRYDEHGAAGLAAEALRRGATPDTVNLGDVISRTASIRSKALSERTRAALEQLGRSADWQEKQKQVSAAVIDELVKSASEAGSPAAFVPNETGSGGAIVFGNFDSDVVQRKPTWVPNWVRRLLYR